MTSAEQLTGLIEEVKGLRDSVEELFILLDHVWRNRSEIYDLLERPTAPALGQTTEGIPLDFPLQDALDMGLDAEDIRQAVAEGVTTMLGLRRIEKNNRRDMRKPDEETVAYCCDDPRLEWNGDPDHPGVACANCDFVVAEYGALLTYTQDEVEEHRQQAKEKQKALFDSLELTDE